MAGDGRRSSWCRSSSPFLLRLMDWRLSLSRVHDSLLLKRLIEDVVANLPDDASLLAQNCIARFLQQHNPLREQPRIASLQQHSLCEELTESVLLSADILPSVFGYLGLGANAAASVCKMWACAWRDKLSDARLLRPDCAKSSALTASFSAHDYDDRAMGTPLLIWPALRATPRRGPPSPAHLSQSGASSRKFSSGG